MAKIGRPIKFVIRLTPEERTRLDGMIHCGKGSVNSVLKARILLKADVSQSGPGWSDERIAEALETSLSTVLRTRRLLVDEGLDAALSCKKSSWSPPRTFDGEAEAKLIALACTVHDSSCSEKRKGSIIEETSNKDLQYAWIPPRPSARHITPAFQLEQDSIGHHGNNPVWSG